MLKTKEEIEIWLEEYNITNYIIHENLSVFVYGNVVIASKKLSKIPIQFDQVKGSFNCSDNLLESLEGAPYCCYESFNCSHNRLTTLQYSPKSVGISFDCGFNDLKTLEGMPRVIYGNVRATNNKLKNLSGSPEIIEGDLILLDNEITSLKGNLKQLDGDLMAHNNLIEQLKIEEMPEVLNGLIHISHKINDKHIEILVNYYDEYGVMVITPNELLEILSKQHLNEKLIDITNQKKVKLKI